MKRIAILIDGTSNKEGITGNTNVAALDPGNRIVTRAFIKTSSADGNPREEHINERVHWSVIAKHKEQKTPLYHPPNLPQHIPAERVAGLTDQERRLLERDT
jgi:hypothetical protein